MENVKNYLKNIFGKEVAFVAEEKEYDGYEVSRFQLNDNLKQFVLVNFENQLEIRTRKIKSIVVELQGELDAIPVLVFDELRLTQRNALVESRIAFVVPGSQIYIPYTVINLMEKEVEKKTYSDYFSVPAQVVYILILLNNIKETNARQLDKKLICLSCGYNEPSRLFVCMKRCDQCVMSQKLLEEGYQPQKCYLWKLIYQRRKLDFLPKNEWLYFQSQLD
jgi:hypothetical protein